jgi:chemotaxis-related protein WspB
VLYLLFSLGADEHALPADRIVQVLPNMPRKRIRGAPPAVVGSIDYRGQFVPIVDLCMLESGRPSTARMGTRIIVTDTHIVGDQRRIGLLLENAVQTFRFDFNEFKPYAQGPHGLVQMFDVDNFVPAALLTGLGADWAQTA